MAAFDTASVKAQARESLRSGQTDPQKWICIHTAVAAGAGLLVSCLQLLLSKWSLSADGLGEMGFRAILDTVVSVLAYAQMGFALFWGASLTFLAICLRRRQPVGKGTLLSGLQLWGPVLRMYLMKGIFVFLAVMLGTQIGMVVFMATPGAMPILEAAMEMTQTGLMDPSQMLTEAELMALTEKMLPFALGASVLLTVPVLYFLRMMDYMVMDRPELGAWFAFRMSLYLVRKNFKSLLKLDVSLWWFWVLELLTAAICWGDVILGLLGVQTGMDPDLLSISFYAGGLVLQLALYWWKKDYICTVYAGAYDAMLPGNPAAKIA